MRSLAFIVILTITLVYTSTVRAAETISNINYKNQPPSTAISPSLSIGSGNDVCIVVRSGAIGTSLFNASAGIHIIDKTCERIKLSRGLAQLGLRVSATAILCQDPRVHRSMWDAGSPCPIDGKIGEAAKVVYKEKGIIDDKDNYVGIDNAIRISISKSSSRNDNLGQPVK
tara:strand:- start:672 stop:1184 length:513 start_codon:yes stop_codon:yes gene_type:complete